jgi:hypothetical protein
MTKGFDEVTTTPDYRYWYIHEGKKTSIGTLLSKGQREYGDRLLGLMARQMRIARADLDEFVQCSLTADGYRDLLLRDGHLRP